MKTKVLSFVCAMSVVAGVSLQAQLVNREVSESLSEIVAGKPGGEMNDMKGNVRITPIIRGKILRVSADSPISLVEIYTLSRQLKISSTETEIYIGDLESGAYLIQVQTDQGIAVEKIVIP